MTLLNILIMHRKKSDTFFNEYFLKTKFYLLFFKN